MLPFEVRRFKTRAGSEVAVLRDRGKGPPFWPNVYVTAEYRKRKSPVNTYIRVLRSLGMVRFWAASLNRDIDCDLTSGAFFSMQDAEDLADFLSLSAAGQIDRASANLSTSGQFTKVVRLEDVRPNHVQLAEFQENGADPAEAAARIRWAAAYVKWHLDRRLGDLERREDDEGILRQLGEDVVARLRQRAPRTKGNDDDEVALEGVPKHVLTLIEEAVLPGSPGNPFKSSFIQARNYLIWRLLLDPGARRGEVREAKADHVKYALRRFSIGVSKTKRRTVPIANKTAVAFDRFVLDYWAKLPQAARRREYLFTDKNGRHLSLRAFNRIFETIRETVPGVPDFMAPHTVRRSWNDAFSERVDALPPEKRFSEKEEIEMRSRLQGWSSQSSMGARYAKRHIKKASDKWGEELAESLTVETDRKSK